MRFKHILTALRNQSSSSIILFAFTAALIPLLAILLTKDLPIKQLDQTEISALIAVGSGFLAIIVLVPSIAKFLYVDKRDRYVDSISTIRHNLDVQNKVDEFIQKNLSIDRVQETVYKKIIANIDSYVTKGLEDKFSANAEADLLNKRFLAALNPLEENVEKHIRTLERNSIVNLIIGIIGTTIAISVLATSTLSNLKFDGFTEFAIHFFPRLTFVISIQLFAFFFLRLYRNNFDDIRYFQNELTNINCKIAAMKLAHYLKKDVDLSDIIKEISKVERNSKLLNGESTPNLEKAKLDVQFDSQTLDMMSKLLVFKQFFKSEEKGAETN